MRYGHLLAGQIPRSQTQGSLGNANAAPAMATGYFMIFPTFSRKNFRVTYPSKTFKNGILKTIHEIICTRDHAGRMPENQGVNISGIACHVSVEDSSEVASGELMDFCQEPGGNMSKQLCQRLPQS